MDLYKDSWLWTCSRTVGYGPVPARQLVMDLYQLDSWLWTRTRTVGYGPAPGQLVMDLHQDSWLWTCTSYTVVKHSTFPNNPNT